VNLAVLRRKQAYANNFRAIESDIDQLFKAVAKLGQPQAASVVVSGGGQAVFNNSASQMVAGRIYGRNASGIVAPALAASGSLTRPKWLVTETTSLNAYAPFAILASMRVYVENPSKTYTIGASMWLSAAVAGAFTDTQPAAPNARWWLGEAAEATPQSDGTLLVDYQIFPQRV
jgi:hypothetical protein